jgi:hypothetical protein
VVAVRRVHPDRLVVPGLHAGRVGVAERRHGRSGPGQLLPAGPALPGTRQLAARGAEDAVQGRGFGQRIAPRLHQRVQTGAVGRVGEAGPSDLRGAELAPGPYPVPGAPRAALGRPPEPRVVDRPGPPAQRRDHHAAVGPGAHGHVVREAEAVRAGRPGGEHPLPVRRQVAPGPVSVHAAGGGREHEAPAEDQRPDHLALELVPAHPAPGLAVVAGAVDAEARVVLEGGAGLPAPEPDGVIGRVHGDRAARERGQVVADGGPGAPPVPRAPHAAVRGGREDRGAVHGQALDAPRDEARAAARVREDRVFVPGGVGLVGLAGDLGPGPAGRGEGGGLPPGGAVGGGRDRLGRQGADPGVLFGPLQGLGAVGRALLVRVGGRGERPLGDAAGGGGRPAGSRIGPTGAGSGGGDHPDDHDRRDQEPSGAST